MTLDIPGLSRPLLTISSSEIVQPQLNDLLNHAHLILLDEVVLQQLPNLPDNLLLHTLSLTNGLLLHDLGLPSSGRTPVSLQSLEARHHGSHKKLSRRTLKLAGEASNRAFRDALSILIVPDNTGLLVANGELNEDCDEVAEGRIEVLLQGAEVLKVGWAGGSVGGLGCEVVLVEFL